MRRSIPAVAAASAILFGILSAPGTAAASPTARHFANCTEMHKVYPHGVGRTHARDHVTSGTPVTNFKRSNVLYAANASSDRDHDHVACEAH
jgi:hypothetical protein